MSAEALLEYTRLYCDYPDRLHPISRLFLEAYFEDRMTTAEFLRFFSLPNSDYIELAACVVEVLGR